MATVLVTGARAPVALHLALHLARLMKAAGHRVLLADSLPAPLARASGRAARIRAETAARSAGRAAKLRVSSSA